MAYGMSMVFLWLYNHRSTMVKAIQFKIGIPLNPYQWIQDQPLLWVYRGTPSNF